MSDHDKIVELAIQAAGVADARWQERVVALVPRIAALLRDPPPGERATEDPTCLANIARKVIEAAAFTAEYRSHEYDENTQRIFVKIFDPKNTDSEFLDEHGQQQVRTEPMWSGSGRAIRHTLDGLQSGQRVVCYRYTEQVDRKRKMGVLIHIEPLGRPPSGAPPQGRQERAVDTAAPPPDQAPAPNTSPTGAPEPHSPADNRALSDIERRFDKLPAKKKIAFGHACKAEGINEFMAPPVEKLERVLEILTHVEST